jgi:Holliday junction resolvase
VSRRGIARLNAKRDANERPIIDTLKARGFCVTQINGKGVPDLLVGKAQRMWLVEVKAPKGKVNAAQVDWRERWTGPDPICLRSVDEAMQFPGILSTEQG